MGYQRFTNEETATQKVVLKEISLKGFKEKPMMLVALKDITVTVGHGHSGLQAHGQVHSATSASLQLVIITAVQPRDVSITWIACGKKSGTERMFFFHRKKSFVSERYQSRCFLMIAA